MMGPCFLHADEELHKWKLIELKSACLPIVEAGSWKLQFKVPQKVGNKTNLNSEVPCEMPKKKKKSGY